MRAVIDELAMLERQEFWLRITFNFVGYMWIWIGSEKRLWLCDMLRQYKALGWSLRGGCRSVVPE